MLTEFVSLIYERTRGNPFFVQEVLRSLVEDGSVFLTSTGWHRIPISYIEIPTTIKAMVKRRLSRLDEESLAILGIASVVGKEFSFEVLRSVSTGTMEEEHLIEVIEKVCRTSFIVEKRISASQSTYAFSDEIIQDVLYEGMSIERRKRYHQSVAQATEQIYKNSGLDEHISELAHHYLIAGDSKKSFEYSIQAAERASSLYSHQEALRHYHNALQLLGQLGEDDRAKVPLLRGNVLDRLGDESWFMDKTDVPFKYWKQAAEVFEGNREMVKAASLYRKIGYMYHIGAFDKSNSLRSYEKALELISDQKDSPEAAFVYEKMAIIHTLTGNHSQARSYAEKALELAGKFGIHEVASEAYQTLGLSSPVEEKEKALEYLHKGLEIAQRGNLADATLMSYDDLGYGYASITGDMFCAAEKYESGVELARKMGYFAWLVWLKAEVAFVVYLKMGKWEKAREIAVGILDSREKIQPYGRMYALLTMSFLCFHGGDLDKSKDYLKQVLSGLLHSGS